MARKTALRNAPDLHVHSDRSLYDGMGAPKVVVDRAVELGWGAACLTEHGWMGSAPALYQAAKAAKIKPIIGCEMYVSPDDSLIDGDKSVLKERRHLTVLALSLEGYQNLVTWVNESMTRPSFYDGPRISIDRMVESAPWPLHHNVVMSGCMGSELCQAIIGMNGGLDFAAEAYVQSMRSAFPNFYIEIHDHKHDKFMGIGLEKYEGMIHDQTIMRTYLLDLARRTGTPVIVANDSHFQSQAQRNAHIAMMARKDHTSRNKDDVAASYTERYTYWTNYMRSMEAVADSLPVWAAKEGIESIHAIVDEADIVLDPLDKHTYTMPRSGVDDPIEEIRKRSRGRLKSLVAIHGQAALDRFEYELDAMGEFAHYLILYSDIVRMARAQGIYSWTRGSAANSIICFTLGIHNIDSIHYKLMFERFVNPARKKLPDIDIDFELHRQPDVARMVVEHMAAIEGPDNVRAVSAYSTVANRAAFRLMALSAGVSPERVDELAKLLPQMIDSGMVTDEEEAYELLKAEVPELHEMAEQMFDAIGSISQHACAFALGTEERPLNRWVPDHLIASSNARVTSYNMKWIEELGFMKLDLLKLETLAIMHDVARAVGKDMEWLDDILRDGPGSYGVIDDDTFTMLHEGRTEGVHSMQGGTQRRGCVEVRPETDFDLVAVQALYRPSGTRTDNDKRFVKRRRGEEEWASTNEFVGEFLDETYGFAIYQEQIMEMGAAMGMSGEEIDDLYKAIKTAKGTGRGAEELFDAFEETFRKYSSQVMSDDDADEVWAQWHTLQGYTFNRGHATSYALLALKMAWLKCHYPREFFTALLNRYPGNPRYVAAALAEGFSFEPPDVNIGTGGFSQGEAENAIRVGLLKIKGVGAGAAAEIVRNQPYASVDDLRERTSNSAVKEPTVQALMKVGALECLGIPGENDDVVDFELLKGFVLRKPKAFNNTKPDYLPSGSTNWKFLGLQTGVKITEGKAFVAKKFWVPPVAGNFVTKSAPMGKYNAHLLTVVDENGLPFDLRVVTDRVAESKLIELLASDRCQGAVVCLEGQVAMPFIRGGNTSFKMWGVTGSKLGIPQMWHVSPAIKKVVTMLESDKQDQQARRSKRRRQEEE